MIIEAKLGLEGIRKRGHVMFDLGGPIQRYIDSAVLKGVEPYLPMRQGTLTRSGVIHSRIGQGQLKWNTPYARPLFRGYRYLRDGGRSKNFIYDQSRHAKAGKEWTERYKEENLSQLGSMVRKRVAQEW